MVMRLRAAATACLLLGVACHAAEMPDASVPAFLGEKAWTSPGWVKVRATSYALGGKSASGVRSCYATAKAVGSASVPYWIPRGSLIRIWTKEGHRVYLAVDSGRGVESREAARKSGKDSEARAEPVIDFCASRQHWPDELDAELFQYVGTTAFTQLTLEQKQQLMAYARRFISK